MLRVHFSFAVGHKEKLLVDEDKTYVDEDTLYADEERANIAFSKRIPRHLLANFIGAGFYGGSNKGIPAGIFTVGVVVLHTLD